MLAELILRNEAPLIFRFGALLLIFSFMVFYAIHNNWLRTNWVLATLPLQRFRWSSESFLSSSFNRIASIATYTMAFGILAYAHFAKDSMVFSNSETINFLFYVGIVGAAIASKLVLMKLFFFLHDNDEIGIMLIDYQYAFNQLITIFATLLVCLDVFYFRLDNPVFTIGLIIMMTLFLTRLLGSILLLLNNFSYPIISLFIYLCAFEIVPMLVVAKVLFVIS
jgi:hypothetical protein